MAEPDAPVATAESETDGRMPTMLRMLPLLALLAGVAHGGEVFRTNDPLKAFVHEGYAWGDDYFIHGKQDTILFRCVLTKSRDDFDGVALSEVSIWGNHGGPWEVFRKAKKGFVYVGSQGLPDTACLESCRSREYLASGRCRWRRGWPTTSPPVGPAKERSAPIPHSTIETLTASDYPAAPFECDCEFYRGRVGGDTTIFATRGHRTLGVAKIADKTRSLRLTSKAAEGDCRKGRSFRERWSDGSVVIDLEGAVTSSGAESCWYQGQMIVTEGRRREALAVRGSCGC